ncbi:hypothetical protein PL11_007910 [Lentilactobacillus curieae]|uniref:Phage shock protein PspC N-terminal domain-containing protein n=1 Tax=Lentilactobacillus curieae TaxID=1138822 RepID=A0A1S6QJS4_9LACO|nr:PspC domain-containing protein [Lentilactobacillus curieae]AQW21846.1 hypothetical protein PL11_007910 [Lentilactobacillus curieae]
MKQAKNFKRSATDKLVAGVLGGISHELNWNSTLVRVLFLILMFTPGINILLIIAYIAAVIMVPSEGSTASFFNLFKNTYQTTKDGKSSRKVIHSVEEHDVNDKGEK